MNAIEVAGVSKTYRIPHERQTTLVERLVAGFRPVPVELLAALQDVTLTVPRGSFVGVIGANGSGKSTLLKVMAGLLVPDAGTVSVEGSVAPLLELGLGFQHELTMRENVALYGTLLGYPRRELARRIDEAIAFAELERFRDAKLKSLSSGMTARLAFATALRADADILLLDEVLAVGDAHFQQKCLAVFDLLRRQEKTIVLVSHDLHTVRRLCDHAYWLDGGRIAAEGPAAEVVGTYLAIAGGAVTYETPEAATDARPSRTGDGRLRYLGGGLEHEDGGAATHVRAGSRVVLRLLVEANAASDTAAFGFVVWRGGRVVYATNSLVLGTPPVSLAAGGRIEVAIPFTAALADGVYFISVAIADRSGGPIHDWVNQLATFVVEGSGSSEGVADLGASLTCRAPSAGTPPDVAVARGQR
jgi:ABC-type polysaccharide/polyol phosphate transport system ATPase subunit